MKSYLDGRFCLVCYIPQRYHTWVPTPTRDTRMFYHTTFVATVQSGACEDNQPK